MLTLYNTYTNKKEQFKPIEEGKVSIYSCGPTVYSYAQIGNFSSFLMADLLVRYLRYKNYEVSWIQNITDVGHLTDDDDDGEDKMEKASKKENKTVWEIARFYEEVFLKDAEVLKIAKADRYPRATEHIEEMIEMVKGLVDKGYAYETSDGVYFDIEKFKDYGKLSGNTLENLSAGKRIEVNEEKKSPYDFALWKKTVGKNEKHSMKWSSPWGVGFPGWHIECSAMSMKYLGKTIDIHTGGEDNKFPHHECEIAQSESYSGKRFVNYWIHKSHIMINSEKMAKSTGNFYTVTDLTDKGYTPEAIRFTFLSAHYRSRMNFDFEALENSQKTINRFNELISELKEADGKTGNEKSISAILKSTRQQFEKGMDDDLNVSAAIASLLGLVKSVNKQLRKGGISKESAEEILVFLKEIDSIFAAFRFEDVEFSEEELKEIEELEKLRLKYREEKNWAEADKIRDQLIKMGVKVKDGKA